jgi:thioredoxin reductase (NADPH)
MDCELGIIGAGPAGCSAAIYAVRSGIKAIIFDKGFGGGLAAISPNIENYAGFESISGIDLTEKMKKHTTKYTKINFNEEVKKITKINDKFIIETEKKKYTTKAVILCTGTVYRKLNIKGEKELAGKGVTYCAVCDGYFFKDKEVAVIGGGNTALVEAVFLKQIGCKKVYLIHRRDQLRAEKAYQEDAIKKGVEIIYETHVKGIYGNEKVEYLGLRNVKNDNVSKLPVDGVFVSIGEEPHNIIAKTLGCKLDENGYVNVDRLQRTTIKGVYAAGDITGGVRQVITACAEGAVAALSSMETLGKQYSY